MIPWLSNELSFPHPETALSGPQSPNGLLAAGGDLSPERLRLAYRHGIFPWYSPGEPILWWSPDPRMVLIPNEMKISRSLAKTLRNATYEVRLDTCFRQVIGHCAQTPRDGQRGTWITHEMQRAYIKLHELGYAHSVETWMDGTLVGGLYGVALGRAFYGESMFSHRSNASKIALAHLCAYLRQREFGIIDCQMETRHLASLGARPIPRPAFLSMLDTFAITDPTHLPAKWPEDGIVDAFRKVQV